MKPKILKKVSNNDYPYGIFSVDNNHLLKKNPLYIYQKSSKSRNIYNKNTLFLPLKTNEKSFSHFISISKSLKTVTLSSNLYSNYLHLYKKLTQDISFKTPKVTEYPLLKNEKYLPIKTEMPVTQETYLKTYNKKISSFNKDKSSHLFISAINQTNEIKNDLINEKYNYKYAHHKLRFDRAKSVTSQKAAKDFRDLNEHNLFETKFMNQIGLRKIDIYNNEEENQKNFHFFIGCLKNFDKLKDIFNENNYYRNIAFNEKTAIKRKKIEFNLGIYSLCFKFYKLSDSYNNKKKEIQKLYFPFELIPIFYLLDFTSFKVFLSEIISFNQYSNCFEYIKENLLIYKLKKYINYISNSLEYSSIFLDNITYNKNEKLFPLIYDWIVTKHFQNDEEKKNNINITGESANNNIMYFKLKIVLPKIKINVDNLVINIIKLLDKHIIANLLQKKFENWEKFIFFDLFSTKRFKIISNLILLNKYNNFPMKKIHLYNKYHIQNKKYEFFLTQIGENYSFHYSFVPNIILVLFGEQKKKFQKINMNIKESKNLNKFGQNWGIINTLFKYMFLDKTKNKIFFRFDLLEDENDELYNAILTEKIKNCILDEDSLCNLDIDKNSKYNFKKGINKNSIKKNQEKEAVQTKYKDKIYEISLLKCTLLKINITSIKAEYKYYQIPSDILKHIFSIKDEKQLFDINVTDIPLICKYIGQNYKSILSAKEVNIISEEEKMIKRANIKEDMEKNEIIKLEKTRNQNRQRLKTFHLCQNTDYEKSEINEKENTEDINRILEKQFSNEYIHPKVIISSRNHKKEISLTNRNETDRNKIGITNRNFIKKRTFTLKHFK